MKSQLRKQKRPVGRPSSYRREYCAKIIKAMATGLSAEAAAAKIGISARSLFYWQREHPEFLQAIQEGRQRGLLWWEKRAQAMAQGKPGNTQIVMLGLRNRSRAAHGWNNETLKVEHSGPDGPFAVEATHIIDVRSMPPKERASLRAFLEAQVAGEADGQQKSYIELDDPQEPRE
jgi:hypothetical protein